LDRGAPVGGLAAHAGHRDCDVATYPVDVPVSSCRQNLARRARDQVSYGSPTPSKPPRDVADFGQKVAALT
jgi:hypothetical protein